MPEIIQNFSLDVQRQWQKELSESITEPEVLLKQLELPLESFLPDIPARRLFPMRVPQSYINRMTPGDPQDPLFLQVMPLRQEFEQHPGYMTDPLEEQDTELPGLLHKYRSRVLLMFKTGCAINCRYCFRRHFPYDDNQINHKTRQAVLDYLKKHPEVNEVILSGGDPLMASDEQLSRFIDALTEIPHIKRLRIHSRLPVVIPSRITTKFASLLSNAPFKTILVFHINHPNEINDELAAAVSQLHHANITLLNQAVLLKGINDDVEVLAALSELLFDNRIMPYYLHVLDKVEGAEHFDMEERRAVMLYKQLMATLPGFLVPKLVREIGGEANKTLISLDTQ